jgi:hypothetical protein
MVLSDAYTGLATAGQHFGESSAHVLGGRLLLGRTQANDELLVVGCGLGRRAWRRDSSSPLPADLECGRRREDQIDLVGLAADVEPVGAALDAGESCGLQPQSDSTRHEYRPRRPVTLLGCQSHSDQGPPGRRRGRAGTSIWLSSARPVTSGVANAGLVRSKEVVVMCPYLRWSRRQPARQKSRSVRAADLD